MSGRDKARLGRRRAGSWRLLERAARVLAHAGAGNPAHRHLFREPAVRVRVERPEDRLRGRSHERDRPSPRAHARCSSTREWETILQQMQAGQYDAIVGGITITPEREQSLAWSTPYMTTTLSIVVDRPSLAADPQHRRPQERLGRRAGGDDRLRHRRQDAAERPDRQREGLLVRPHPGRHGRSRRGPHHGGDEGLSGGRLARPADARPRHRGEVPDDPQPLGIGFARNNPGLLAAVNRALADMKRDGTYARLAQKWGVP